MYYHVGNGKKDQSAVSGMSCCNLHIRLILADSSYLLDMSGIEEEEAEEKNEDSGPAAMSGVEELDRNAVIEDVPEYAEDIYNYLLTVEVSPALLVLQLMM